MIIRDLSLNEKTTFYALEVGDTFKYDHCLFLKINENPEISPANAYNFEERRITTIDSATQVSYVPSELILHERGWKPKV